MRRTTWTFSRRCFRSRPRGCCCAWAMVSGAVKGDEKQGPVKLMFVDVKKAHLSGRLKDFEFAYVSLPKEAGGFVRGRSAPTVMLYEQRGIRLVVWDDDFTFLGRDLDLKWVAGVMTARYEIKIRAILGPESHNNKEVRILNRKVRWEVNQILYQGDEKHVHTIIRDMGLKKDSRGLDSPVVQEAENVTEGDELDRSEAYKYRHLAATVNYLSMDRPDVQFAASVLGRAMSRPTVQSMVALKRVARYLLKHPSMEFEYSRTSIEEASVMEGVLGLRLGGVPCDAAKHERWNRHTWRLRLEVLEQSTGLRGTFERRGRVLRFRSSCGRAHRAALVGQRSWVECWPPAQN